MTSEHGDVLIVGAGLSGIGAGYHLQQKCPGKSYAILEGRDCIGGTWDLFRYPGIRSDSDMFTLGYSFKPWTEPKAIADGPRILNYVRETAAENDLEKDIRFRHRVKRAMWSTPDARWTVEAERSVGEGATEVVRFTCSFLFMCSGYYKYEAGYAPEFAGAQDFAGRIVHPQQWPEDLDYAGKRVVVVGSGATAVCLVPDGDLFKAIRDKRASVVTSEIDTFTKDGIRLKDGSELAADIIVTATGLVLQVLGGLEVSVDGRAVDFAKTLNYKGMMYSDVPNLASAFGYTNASWTLKCDLTCEYVCRLINYMDRHGYKQCVPHNLDPTISELPSLDFSSGYVHRSIAKMPNQGSKRPCRRSQTYD